MTATETALRAESLVKEYGARRALQGVSFEAAAGELVAVIGPERRRQDDAAADPRGRARRRPRGRCRSTAARSAGCRSSRRSTGSSPSPRTCGSSPGSRGWPTSPRRWRGCSSRPGSRDRADDAVGTLSGGNQQRVNIAVGLLGEPRLLLLDEPSSSLDPRQRERLWEFVATLAREDATTVVYTTHNVAEAERHADRRAGARRRGAAVHGHAGRARSARPASTRRWTSRARSCGSCGSAGTDALAAAQGPADPPAVAAARGAAGALSAARRAAGRRRALVRSVEAEGRVREPGRRPARRRSASAGSSSTRRPTPRELFENVDPIRVDSREEAIAKVESGEALGALVIPPDVIERLQNRLSLGGGDAPTVEVYFSAENPLKRRYVAVDDRRDPRGREQGALRRDLQGGGRLPRADRLRRGDRPAARRRGRHPRPPQRPADHRRRARRAARGRPVAGPARAGRRASRSSRPRTSTSPSPSSSRSRRRCRVDERALGGSRSSLDVFGVEVAVLLSLMVVTLLLAAGMLALEREEHAFGRLVRGLVSRTGLLAEKIMLAAICGGALAIVMLAVLSAFLDLGWSRVPAWVLALIVAAAGVRGAGRRDRRPRPRGARGVAARVHDRAADRRAGAHPVGRRRAGRSTT